MMLICCDAMGEVGEDFRLTLISHELKAAPPHATAAPNSPNAQSAHGTAHGHIGAFGWRSLVVHIYALCNICTGGVLLKDRRG